MQPCTRIYYSNVY